MTTYSTILSLHIVAMLLLVPTLSFEALTLARWRRTTTGSEARLWMDLVPGLPILAIGSLLTLLLSGGYLAELNDGWTLAWPKASLSGLVNSYAVGSINVGRNLARQRTTCQINQEPR